jgi:hypothetical protein
LQRLRNNGVIQHDNMTGCFAIFYFPAVVQRFFYGIR